MMIWKEYSNCLSRLTKYSIFLLLLLLPLGVTAQTSILYNDYTLLELRLHHHEKFQLDDQDSFTYLKFSDEQETEVEREEFPEPKSVMYRSMIIPGWGQITNRQIWKVPIIYGLFAGVGYYSYTLTEQFRGYRAAYYNETRGADSDFRFGPTPDFIPDGLTTQQLRETRDNLRNQRDFSYIIMVLAYGLNVLDAYVYAHMRSFDVSDDLSANTTISPGILEQGSPGINVRINLQTK
jgi:hypothetical protein